jgi:hypothetical protein
MRRELCASLALALLLALLTQPLCAQEQILEKEDGTFGLQYCDFLHRTATCESVHVQRITGSKVGGIIVLNDRPFVITWIGPGYYLDSGIVVQASGEPAERLVGQRWLEVYPVEGRIHVSRAWKDRDADGILSFADGLQFDVGYEMKVRDIRLNLRVKPLPAIQ